MLIIEIKNRLHSLPIVNYIFLGVIVVLAGVTRISFGDTNLEAYAFEPAEPELWQLLLSPFLHAGPIALLYNVFHLFFYGDNVENMFGSFRYFWVYIFCGVAGVLTYGYVYPDSAASIVGSSAAVAGIMGAYLALFPNTPIRLVGQARWGKLNFPTRFYIGFLLWLPIYLFLDAAFEMSSNGREGSIYIVLAGLFTGILLGILARQMGFVRRHLKKFREQRSSLRSEICPHCYSELDPVKSGAYYCRHCQCWMVISARGTRIMSVKSPPE